LTCYYKVFCRKFRKIYQYPIYIRSKKINLTHKKKRQKWKDNLWRNILGYNLLPESVNISAFIAITKIQLYIYICIQGKKKSIHTTRLNQKTYRKSNK